MFSPFSILTTFSGGFAAQCASISSQAAGFNVTSSMLQSSSAGDAMIMAERCAGSSNGSANHLAGTYAAGHPHKQSSPLLDDTLAAVMTSHLGNSPMDYLPDYWTETMPQQEASTAYMGAQQQHSKSQQQQPHMLQQSHAQLAAGPAAAAAADPNAVLYANYRAQHPQAYAEADRLSYSIDMSSAAIAAAAHHQQQQGMLAAEQAFKARQLAQLQQQRLAYEQAQQQQHQQLVLAQLQQQRQAATAAVPAATANASALYRASSSHSAMTQQQHLPSSSYSHQQPSHYQTHSSMQAPSTTAARLPPRPSTTHSHHYHPYSTATGGAALEHHAADSRHNHHNSLVAAAAAARAAAVQQQNHRSSAATAARQAANAAAAAAAAALQRSNNAGRWSGAVAVLDQSYMTGTQESGIELECEEELHSMDGSDQAPHHHMMHSNAVASGGKNSTAAASAGDVARGLDVHQRSQLQGARLSGGAAQHAAAASAAARAAAANMALNALEDDDQGYDMYEESGSTHPDSDNQLDDMDADIVPVQDQHQRNSRNSTSAAEGSSAGQPGSRAAAAAAAVAGEQTSAAQQAVAVRILSSVANRRKGEEVLTAHPSTADAAGARSVRSRLLITEVSLYCDNAATSILALEQSNRLMAKMKLPDGIKYMPVSTDSFLFRAAHAWQFPAFVICLGSSYMQRMLAKLPQLTVAAAACPGFEDYCRYLPSLPNELPARLMGEEATSTTATLRSIMFTCLFIATKVADQVHAMGLLRFILTHLSHHGLVVSVQQATDVEARCLESLDWRLGPFFLEDDLTDDDLEMWAAAMGHWDYGTAADGSIVSY